MATQNTLACPNCQMIDQVQSVPVAFQENQSNRIAESLYPPADYHPVSRGYVSLQSIFFAMPIVKLLGWALGGFGSSSVQEATNQSTKEKKRYSSRNKVDFAIQRWNDTFFCRRCGRVFDPASGQSCILERSALLDFWFND
jgi:hypothetical protein